MLANFLRVVLTIGGVFVCLRVEPKFDTSDFKDGLRFVPPVPPACGGRG